MDDDRTLSNSNPDSAAADLDWGSDNERKLVFVPPVSLFFVAAGLVLIALAPWQVKWIGHARGWYTQPAFAPLLGLAVMTLFAALRLYIAYRHEPDSLHRAHIAEHTSSLKAAYRIPVIVGCFFLTYLGAIPFVGFAPASLVFILAVLWLTDLRNRFWCAMAVLAVIGLVLIFRVALGLWLPDAALYELLPDAMRDLANRYF